MTAGKKTTIVLLLIAVIANTIPRWIHGMMICGRKVYYIGQALSFVLIILAGGLKNVEKKSEVVDIAFEASFMLALMNLSDELFFDPVTFGLNEKLIGSAIVIWTTYRVVRSCQRNHHQKP